MWKLFRSKTVWGAVLVAAASVINAPAVTVSVIVKAVGTVLTAAGVRDALHKVEDAAGDSSNVAPGSSTK